MNIVLLNLRISMWGISRVLPDQQYEVDADCALVRATCVSWIRSGLQSVKVVLDTLVEDAPTRQIVLRD